MVWRVSSKDWAEMIPKVLEVDPLLCPGIRATIIVIDFLRATLWWTTSSTFSS
jgi:hypothetical protein